jgi:trans-aconitate 2-methyltransferase
MWNRDQYLKFMTERARPFFDLLARIPPKDYRHIVDLGCGPGNLTRVLAEQWPQAKVTGVDNSPAMLADVVALTIPGRLEFAEGDITTWNPPDEVDLLVSNAVLQWVAGHESLLPRLAAMLADEGALAVQLPIHMNTPAQQAVAQVVQRDRWRSMLAGVGLQPGCVKPLACYVQLLLELGFQVEAWETSYMHLLPGDNPVLEWMKGTAVRPLLERLSDTYHPEFLAELGTELRAAYPPQRGVTIFPFPRLFFVATRKRS